MKLTPVKTPVVAKKMFPNYIWDIATTTKELFLTFDDGPTPDITNWTLKILDDYNAKATFFCVGGNIDQHPDIYQNIIEAGHSIGNHTQHHIKGWATKTNAYIDNVSLAEHSIGTKLHTKKTKLFRPPYGQIKPQQGKKLIELGYKIVMWDVLSFDWDQDISEEQCLENVISKSKSGSIIVFHDSIKASKNMMYALPKVLEKFSLEGYKFKALEF
ncbi:polysaccharide deacetylase family protein [Psychroserpens algicola]|uniref:Polysaccharide deacetylase family protein n=1 Tax=Psychroserpens algicola TaxID=1719034 RepID=A0ABT0H9L4_9FLAO|nr:polysaccharide deacetylase family protein [Psychroserpens algicola]MCK8481066.1 polysaccharide deacetylase family protein [Psychroserpens algicola]